MSATTKKKYVAQEVMNDFCLPEENQQIVRIIAGRGNNLHEVEDPSGKSFLVSMPSKFRKNIWIKRGDYVLVDPIAEGDKVQAEIVTILFKEQIKYIKQEGCWPQAFADGPQCSADEVTQKLNGMSVADHDYDSSDSESDLFVNPNRAHQPIYYESDDSSNEESGSEDGESGENDNEVDSEDVPHPV